ncbi:Ras and EF-hand domain-containing protein [Portunus trituberculatus]|uniref:Ras and EF-hand domain-containing protein n=1 Tax=Portunus trituberculatus TaxID=210409 RepID=A0A5B7EEX3_PORTR|nr:Ras and EF-hand domain-containing protein [Portunus trituberculatus]
MLKVLRGDSIDVIGTATCMSELVTGGVEYCEEEQQTQPSLRKGFIVREELRDLCSSLAIADEDSDVIFTDLDQDKDGKISYKEFSKGFIEFLHRDTEKTEKQVSNGTNGTEEREDAPEQTEGKEGCEQSERRRRASVHQAWSALTSNLPELSKSCLVTSKR